MSDWSDYAPVLIRCAGAAAEWQRHWVPPPPRTTRTRRSCCLIWVTSAVVVYELATG